MLYRLGKMAWMAHNAYLLVCDYELSRHPSNGWLRRKVNA